MCVCVCVRVCAPVHTGPSLSRSLSDGDHGDLIDDSLITISDYVDTSSEDGELTEIVLANRGHTVPILCIAGFVCSLQREEQCPR